MYIREALGHVIREHRQEKGWTMRKLSAVSYSSLGYISEIERGIKEPSSQTVRSIAEALGTTDHALIIEAGYLMQEFAGLTTPASRAMVEV